MSNVEFSEENADNAALKRATEKASSNDKRLSALPIRLGLAKDDTGATIILLGVGLFALTLGILIFFNV